MENYQTDLINMETPRIRKFYEKYSRTGCETPLPSSRNFLQLLASPKDGQSLMKLQCLTLRHQDVITSQFDNSASAIKTRAMSEMSSYFSTNKTTESAARPEIKELLFECDGFSKKLTFNMQDESSERTTNPGAHYRHSSKQNESVSHKYSQEREREREREHERERERDRSLRDITSRLNNAADRYDNSSCKEEEDNSKEAVEIRKRKRKSNQQLKILKLEFDRDGFWGKDKILNVARITGLSESQVYKWCWDQKKKKETDPRMDDFKGDDMSTTSKGSMYHDKENMSPIDKLGSISKHSKHIFKTKNSSNFMGIMERSNEKYHKKYSKMRYESNVPKRIDFSLEQM